MQTDQEFLAEYINNARVMTVRMIQESIEDTVKSLRAHIIAGKTELALANLETIIRRIK